MAAGEKALAVAKLQQQKIIEQLQEWVLRQLHDLGVEGEDERLGSWSPLGGDAGFRRYFRFCNSARNTSLLAVWAPPATEKNREFVQIARFLKSQGLATPEVFAFDIDNGFLLLEDLGEQLLLDRLNSETADTLYVRAVAVLNTLQKCPTHQIPLPRYDAAELQREMALFCEWFVPQLLGYKMSETELSLIHRFFMQLQNSALQQPQVIVHRDYHSRNLIYRESQPFGVIDFQDALVGPISYDLVSLLRDCYIAWPQTRVEGWLKNYFALAIGDGLLPQATTFEDFEQWFDWMGLQRHIKVLGIFSRLWLRDGKQAYLNDLPLVIHYVRSVATRYPDLSEFIAWFDSALWPLILQQPWMRHD